MHDASQFTTNGCMHVHCLIKKVTNLSCCNFDIHESILINFWQSQRCYPESKQAKDTFPPHLTSGSGLPDETETTRMWADAQRGRPAEYR